MHEGVIVLKRKARGFNLVDKDGSYIPGTEARNKLVLQTMVDDFSQVAGVDCVMIPWDLCAGKAEPDIHRILCGSCLPQLADLVSPENFRLMARDGYASTPADHTIREGFLEMLLQHKDEGIYSALVTSSDADVVRASLQKAFAPFDIHPNEVFPLIVTKTEVLAAGKNPKPSPDPFLMAYETMQNSFGAVSPDSVFIYEDSPTGVEAGYAFFDAVSFGGRRAYNVIQFVDDTPHCNLADHHVTTIGECVSIVANIMGRDRSSVQNDHETAGAFAPMAFAFGK